MFSKWSGKIIIDSGARDALQKGKTLLPSGIIGIEGKFSANNIVRIVYERKDIGRGVSEYSSEELQKIKGARTDAIEKILDYKSYDSVIRRENMIIN